MKSYHFTAQIERDNETGLYIGIIPNVPGAHTQAKSLDKLKKNLHEVLQLCLENMTKKELDSIPEFIGFQQVSVAV